MTQTPEELKALVQKELHLLKAEVNALIVKHMDNLFEYDNSITPEENIKKLPRYGYAIRSGKYINLDLL